MAPKNIVTRIPQGFIERFIVDCPVCLPFWQWLECGAESTTEVVQDGVVVQISETCTYALYVTMTKPRVCEIFFPDSILCCNKTQSPICDLILYLDNYHLLAPNIIARSTVDHATPQGIRACLVRTPGAATLLGVAVSDALWLGGLLQALGLCTPGGFCCSIT